MGNYETVELTVDGESAKFNATCTMWRSAQPGPPALSDSFTPELEALFDKSYPPGRIGEPTDVANMMVFLVGAADALVEVSRPGVMECLSPGLGVCHPRNARLVYGRVIGYGRSGPLADLAGHDMPSSACL